MGPDVVMRPAAEHPGALLPCPCCAAPAAHPAGRAARLVVGGAQVRRNVGSVSASAGGEIPAELVGGGVYLQIAGRRPIQARCPHGTEIRTHGTEWAAGPRRRRWHASVTPADVVCLRYVLAERRMLTVR